ncbi:hypothetical protein UPYG_G00302400 [Umbra pygmaea]|uniref:Trichohyalin-like n=1 Tax=Umbra pygmaea TaxID=75934 RepID=A0ABD0W704_UMBPY
MAESRVHNQFKLNTGKRVRSYVVGDDVILHCHLSPETSAVTMTIRWFKQTKCIYLYKNGQVTERTGYEDRLSLNNQELERGNVSLTMKNFKEPDKGVYICQVINGEQKEEVALWLWTKGGIQQLLNEELYRTDYLHQETQEEKLQREKSAVELDQFKLNTGKRVRSYVVGDDVILHCHLSPETSAVTMTIRWFKQTKCIYLYKNGQVTERTGYEDRLSLNNQELERGNVSLTMKNFKEPDKGVYICQVINGEQKEEVALWLWTKGGIQQLLNEELYRKNYLQDETQEKKLQREKSADELELKMEREEDVRALSHPVVKTKKEEKDIEMENMKKTLRESKEKITLEKKNKELMEKDSTLEEKNKELMKKDSTLEEKNKELMKKDSTLEEKNKELMEKDSTLEEKKKELMEKDSTLEKKNKELMEKQLNQNIKHLQEKDTHLDDLTQQVREKENSLENTVKEEEKEHGSCANDGRRNLRYRPESSQRCTEEDKKHERSPYVSREQWSSLSVSRSKLRLVLLGRSGPWRRAARNTILCREEFGPQASPSAVTQRSVRREGDVCGRPLMLVDTPDWFCPGLSLEDMRQDVGLCVRLSAPGPHAFLLVIPVETSKEEDRGLLERMEDMFGEGCWGHTVILFTHDDSLKEQSIEEFLQAGSQDLQQLVEMCGSRYHVLNIKDRTHGLQVSELLEKVEEMVSGNKESFYSSQSYQETETKVREMERKIQKEREERKQREEREMRERHEKEIQEISLIILNLNEQIAELKATFTELEIEEERDEEMKKQLEREMKTKNEVIDNKVKERKKMKERHKEEIDEIMEMKTATCLRWGCKQSDLS